MPGLSNLTVYLPSVRSLSGRATLIISSQVTPELGAEKAWLQFSQHASHKPDPVATGAMSCSYSDSTALLLKMKN